MTIDIKNIELETLNLKVNKAKSKINNLSLIFKEIKTREERKIIKGEDEKERIKNFHLLRTLKKLGDAKSRHKILLKKYNTMKLLFDTGLNK